MSPPTTPEPSDPAGQPHRDPARFGEVIESVGPDSCIVAIAGWMGPVARGALQAEDVWQETLVCAWRDRDRHRWTDVRDYRRWLLSIARNRVVDAVRAAGAEKRGGAGGTVMMGDLAAVHSGSVGELLPPGTMTPSRAAVHRERAARVLSALESLPDDLRDVVRLHLFEELPMAEIAGSLGLGLSNAWYRFRRGSALLAEALDGLESRSVRPDDAR